MQTSTKLLLSGIVLSMLLMACAAKNKFAETNKVYTKNVEKAAETIKEHLPPPLPPPVTPSPEVFIADVEGKRNDLEWVGTVNFNLRKPDFVILHHTAQDSVAQTLRTFTLERTQVSAHYVISRDGKTYQMLNDYLRAWHAGVSKWGTITDMNSQSIGIELDNNGVEPFTTIQITSLLRLLDTLKTTYNIPTQNFIGHSDISPVRKKDPSVHFPWKILADHGFGVWYDVDLVTPPESFDPITALRIIGYDTRNLRAAIIAFKRHFIQSDISQELTPFDIKVIYNLYCKLE